MSCITLTGCERVNRMFERKEQDRIPRHDTFWPETIKRWQGEGLKGDAEHVLELLKSDYQMVCWCWPAPYPRQDHVIEEDEQTQIVRNAFGALTQPGIGSSWCAIFVANGAASQRHRQSQPPYPPYYRMPSYE